MTKTKMLMGASALVALALAGGAHASTSIYGGGSSLIAPDINQAGNCWGTYTTAPVQGSGPPYTGSAYAATVTQLTTAYFDFIDSAKPTLNQNCATTQTTTNTVNYISTGSGNGINGFYSHDAQNQWGDTTTTDGSWYPSVDFANSDYGLTAADVGIWNSGGTEGGVTVVSPTGTANPPTTYPNPAKSYGPQIQFPIIIVPVALAYSPVYKSVADGSGNITNYTFNIAKPNADGSGGLVLDVPTICAIFNGQITLWSDPALTALNGGKSLKNKNDTGNEFATLPIEMVGRKDSSGTNTIFYRALAQQCPQTPPPAGNASPNYTAVYTEGGHNITYTSLYLVAGSKKEPTSLQGNTYAGGVNNGVSGSYTQLGIVGKYTLATNSSGVAQYIDSTTVKPAANQTLLWGRLGYLSPDYALPAVTNSQDNTYGLNVVDVKVGTKALEPTGANGLLAFGTYILPPQSNSAGAYVSGTTTAGLRSAPGDWAEPFSTSVTFTGNAVQTAPLADPNAWAFKNNGGVATTLYPFTGTSNVNLYSCYAASATANAVTAFYKYYLTSATIATAKIGLLAYNGFSPMPKAWTTAITDTFLLAPPAKGNLGSLGLYVSTAGSTAPQCASVTPGA
jgi:phosphate transport system substrate-binding protein